MIKSSHLYGEVKALKDLTAATLFIGLKKTFKSGGFKVVTKGSPLEATFEEHIHALDGKAELGFHSWQSPKGINATVGFLVLDEKFKTLEVLEGLRSALAAQITTKTLLLRVVIDESLDTAQISKSIGIAVSAKINLMPRFGKAAKEAKPHLLKEVQILGFKNGVEEFKEGLILGEASHQVRALGMTPGNFLNPKIYGTEIKKVCAKNKLNLKFHSNKILKAKGAGAFTAVDQGDPNSSGGIYEITYKPKNAKNKSPIALVGKGLCFDTGGYNIKTGSYMITMKGDMQGSAVALSTIEAASRLKLPLHLKAWLAVTENHISPKAFKPDDVVTALNGKTIEIVDTDAEGRMVLADALTLATREKPQFCLDFATLTGSAVRAVGTRMGVGFSNDESLHPLIKECGVQSGERIWPFPLDSDYGKALESKVADILQCSASPGPDHIWAAYFLSQFIEHKTAIESAPDSTGVPLPTEGELVLVRVNAHRMRVIVAYDPHLVKEIKQVPFAKWDDKNKWWNLSIIFRMMPLMR